MTQSAARARILREMRRLRSEIDEIFIDCAAWNNRARKPDEDPLDPDPFGDLRRLAEALDATLAADRGRGPIPPLVFTRSQ